MSFHIIDERLARGEVVLLDGATGTELERRGAVMSDEAWCAPATLTHGHILRAIHDDYIAAGSDLITANTYGSSPYLLDHYGKLDDLAVIDRRAIEIARQAADAAGRDIAVAGSFSVMRPAVKGTDLSMDVHWTPARARDICARKADGLAAAGADLIAMEMMRDIDHSLWATEAAVATELPVFVGISAVRGKDGTLRAYERTEFSYAEVVKALTGLGVAACLVMHSAIEDTADAIAEIKAVWSGPVGAYPESGFFEMPSWRFVDIIPPADFAARADSWRTGGAQLLGGCCGTGPEHIRALADMLRRQ